MSGRRALSWVLQIVGGLAGAVAGCVVGFVVVAGTNPPSGEAPHESVLGLLFLLPVLFVGGLIGAIVGGVVGGVLGRWAGHRLERRGAGSERRVA
jgi:hypothetical protein